MKQVVFAFTAMLATVTPTIAQQPSVVFTNIIDGQRVPGVVRVLRVVTPAIPVPSSIVSTEVLPKGWRAPMGPSSYVPSAPVPAMVQVPVVHHRPVRQPWFVNGIYAGASPNGSWMATSVGRPVVDVRIISPPRHHTSRSRQENPR